MFGAKSNPKTQACFGKSFVAAQWEVHGVVSNKPIGATKVFSNPMMMYARRHSTSGSQSLISCKKHRQSLIQSLISVSARGDHVGAKSNPKTHACFWKIFCSGTVDSSGCSVQQTYLVDSSWCSVQQTYLSALRKFFPTQ